MSLPRPTPSDQAVRLAALREKGRPTAVDASAGTGKTHLLLDRVMVLLLEEGVRLSRLAAITFTEKATEELSTRLRRRLEEEWKERKDRRAELERALEDLETAPIGTIHGFCAGVLREHALSAGLDPRFTVLDPSAAADLEEETFEEWLRSQTEAPALSRAMTLGVTLSSLLLLKGRMLAHRASLRPPKASPWPTASEATDLLTAGEALFARCAKVCRKEEDTLARKVATFREAWERASHREGEDRVMATAVLAAFGKLGRSGNKASWGEAPLQEAREELMDLGERLEAFRAKAQDAALTGLLVSLWGWVETHQAAKRRRGQVDFDDMLLLTRDLLDKDPSTRETLKARHDILLVDEFQDTDPLQAEVVFRLCEARDSFAPRWREARLAPGKLMVVGDPKQSIYRFRRADVATYHEVLRAIEATSGRGPFVLRENFRSAPALTRWVHAVFGPRFEGRLEGWAEPAAFRPENDGEGALPPLTALLVEVPEEGSAEDARRREAETIAAHLRDLLASGDRLVWDRPTGKMRPLRAGDIAILLKDLSNNEECFEDALRAAGVPHQVVGGRRFYRRGEIVALSNLLTALDSPADEASVVATLRGPLYGFPDEALVAHRQKGGSFRYLEGTDPKSGLIPAFEDLKRLRERCAQKPVAEAVRMILSETPLFAVTLAEPYGEQRAANLLKVVDQAAALEASETLTFRSFAGWLRRHRDEEVAEGEAPGPESTGDRVTLMTVHKSKGLEFPVVVVPNASLTPRVGPFLPHRLEGTVAVKVNDLATLDYGRAKEEEETCLVEETLRLLYVAVTRAQDALILPWRKDTDETGFLYPLGAGWDWKEKDWGLTQKLPCGTTLHLSEVRPLREDLDGATGRLAYEPEGIENPEAIEAAERFAAIEKARGEETQRRLQPPKRRTAHDAPIEGEEVEGEERTPLHRAAAPSSGARDGMGFGSLVHRLLELSGREEAKPSRAAAWAKALGIRRERVEEAFRAVESLERSGIGARIRASRGVFRELPLTVWEAEATLDGRVDLAFLEDGAWVLVDFKTDRDPERLLARYEGQMNFYAGLLVKTTGLPVKEALLVFLRGDGSPAMERCLSLS